MPITGSGFHPELIHHRLKNSEGEIFLLGFSGGGDSLALLCLSADWAQKSGSAVRPVIIDHALRPESGEEARWAAARAKNLGLEPLIVKWTGGKPSAGVQAAARDFRLKTFARLARELGAATVLLGHTLEDQAETVWRRILSGGGWHALAGMTETAPLPVWPEGRGLTIIRPLLGLRRAALRSWLEARGETWIDDPTNENTAFARVRDRLTLSRLESAGFDRRRLCALAAQLQSRQTTIAKQALRWIETGCAFHGWGGIRIDSSTSPPVEAMDAMRSAVTGWPASDRPAAQLLCSALQARQAATAGGAALTFFKGIAWLIRDPGAVSGRADGTASPPARVQIGTQAVWDGRFLVHNLSQDIRPLALSGSEIPGAELMTGIPALARPGLPTVWKASRFEGVAGLTAQSAEGHWLARELIVRNLFGATGPGALQIKLRGDLAQGSH
ncbi:tRNA lysidine(34) synthetase TilS [Hyphobacterium sp.]|uniref:tRNA lysidine(34) synthetase TilS n=1 Tax=Hyphobacterium sp. TaxID=2004662 RepID=UPI003BAC3A31